MIIKRTSEPQAEPLSTTEVKLHTHISHSVEDTLIAQWIKSGRIAIEQYTNRSLVEQTYEVYFDGWPLLPVELPRPPLMSISAVNYYGEDGTEYTMTNDKFIIDNVSCPGRLTTANDITLPTTLLRSINSVKITYKAGYVTALTIANLPEIFKDALYVYCTWRNENRAGETDIPRAFYDILRPVRLANV